MSAPSGSFLSRSFEMVTVHLDCPSVDIPAYKGAISEDGLITLPGVSERTFRLFLHWAHRRTSSSERVSFVLDSPPVRADHSNEDDSEHHQPDLFDEAPAFLRGQCFDIPELTCHYFIRNEVCYLNLAEMKRVYWENQERQTKYNHLLKSLLELRISADRFCLFRLRDDIISSLFGHAQAHQWWRAPDAEILDIAYSNLPSSCQFIRFLVLSAVYYWVPTGDTQSKV
ncbi:hypothetical protein CC80DRAFT_592730 [Byssothecium circinans]|uniref:Uncharacterized protein n=1 Tax=Byssothecium circinans TaxID=147558 RepID=A0A6A5U0U6_9PLEO|nr:hypothetical protein CC80DRAFT_592730 [Byssothecium circinans]